MITPDNVSCNLPKSDIELINMALSYAMSNCEDLLEAFGEETSEANMLATSNDFARLNKQFLDME